MSNWLTNMINEDSNKPQGVAQCKCGGWLPYTPAHFILLDGSTHIVDGLQCDKCQALFLSEEQMDEVNAKAIELLNGDPDKDYLVTWENDGDQPHEQ